MSERLDGIAVIQIEDDEVIAELKNIENDCVQKEEEKIKSLNKEKEPYLREIEKYEERIKPFRKEFDELAEVEHKELELKHEYERKYIDSHPYPELAIGHVMGYSSSILSDTGSYSSSSYSSYSSYSSSSFYGQDNYAKEQTEALRAQAEEARKQTEIAQQQLRDMQKQKLKAEEEERKRRAAEFHQKQVQDLAIVSRCSSCSVISCGMRFNKSNVNCAGYKPKR